MLGNSCPECGAILTDELTCESVFNKFLALEFTDVEYGAVHLLTVACYMIQHNQYSQEGLIWISQTLDDYLIKNIPVEKIRKQTSQAASREHRNWRIRAQKGKLHPVRIPWSMTIIDVASQYHDADSYRNLIKKWARTTLQEMQPLLPTSK